jgi:hypothetical protein
MKFMKRIIGITFVFLVLSLPAAAQSACGQLGAMTGVHVDCSHPQIQQRPSETPAYSPAVLPPDSPFYHQPPSPYRGSANNRGPAQQQPAKPACHSTRAHCKAGEYNYEEGPSVADLKKREAAARDLADRMSRANALMNEGWALAQKANYWRFTDKGFGLYNEALAKYDVAVSLYPNWPNWTLQRAAMLMALRRDDDAMTALDEFYRETAAVEAAGVNLASERQSAQKIKDFLIEDKTERMYQAKAWTEKVKGFSIHEPPTPWIEGKSWTGKVSSEGSFQFTTTDGNVITQENPDKLARVSLANAHLTTGSGGTVHLLLPDETIFSVGPNSDITLDEFVYDPRDPSNTKIAIDFSKGVFRWVTGKVVKHENVKLNVPIGDLGFRGTSFVVYSGIDSAFSELMSDDPWIKEHPDRNRAGFIIQYEGQSKITPPPGEHPRQCEGNYTTAPPNKDDCAIKVTAGHYINFAYNFQDSSSVENVCTDPDCSNAFRQRDVTPAGDIP